MTIPIPFPIKKIIFINFTNNHFISFLPSFLKTIHDKRKKESNWKSGNNTAVTPGNKVERRTLEGHNRHYPMFAAKHALPARKETCNPSKRKLSPLCANYKFVNWQVDPPRVSPRRLFPRGGKNDDDAYNRSLLPRERDRFIAIDIRCLFSDD